MTKTDAEIVDLLAKADPVLEIPNTEGRRGCAICRAVGAKNVENVAHEADCPWLLAMKSRDPYGPGGKWDRRKCADCGTIFENWTVDLNVSRLCRPCLAMRGAA